jgi:ABC-type Na+ efflux pump permease subunit
MKKFGVIFQYEIMNYIKNKSFMISTIVIAVLAAVILFLPSVFDMSGILGINKDDTDNTADNTEITDVIIICDEKDIFAGTGIVEGVLNDVKIENVSSRDALVDKIENDENVIAGFVVKNATDFEYVVNNSDMFDDMTQRFTYAMQLLSQYNYCKENNLDMAEIENAFNPVINSETTVLGKDMMSNYWYCYALIIIVFMVIILYGVMVATSVTQEKSNRTIELLVTSADTNSLFFGKVLAGTSAALLQVGIIFAVILGSYKINRDSWGGLFDKIFNIPSDVLITFAFFGLGGLLFYVFIYGAMGALVSKTEDINKSAGSVQFVIMIVYFIGLSQLNNVDGILMKVLSFLPISSYSAMFARVALGNVSFAEIAVSFVILIVSTIAVGILGSKIYRMGTLWQSNYIKKCI